MVWIAGALLAGSLVFCLLVVLAALRYRTDSQESLRTRRSEPRPEGAVPPISILKPLAGVDEGLKENLRSYFEQDYPEFEILFAVEHAGAAVVPIVERLRAEYPNVPSQLLLTGEAPYPNPKSFKLGRLVDIARYDLLLMADSDVRVTRDMLRVIAAEFRDPAVGLATCPYRAVPGPNLWSQLEALMMNTEFLGGVLVARMLEGMKFALGPTIVVRKPVLAQMGGFDAIKNYCAEDFVLGNRAAELGHKVILSAYVIEHRIANTNFRATVPQRMRWVRSTRRSRPAGYLGQVFTNPLPLLLLFLAVQPSAPALLATALCRAAAAWATAILILRDPLTLRRPWLLPIADLVNFAFWVAGFFGNTIHWRGDRYYLLRDGTYRPVRTVTTHSGTALGSHESRR